MPPKTRPTQVPEKTPPVGLRSQRTTNSESAVLRRKPSTDRSPNLMIRGSQSDPLGQKKLGTRVSCLETQLIQAQQELKNLKQQLSSAETTKKEKTKKNPTTKHQIDHQGKCADKEMDVFEVPMQDSIEFKPEENVKLPFPDEMDTEKNEIEQVKAELDVKEKELESVLKENEILKNQLNEANAEISTARMEEAEMVKKCSLLEIDLEESKVENIELKEKVKAMEEGKEELEVEMKKLRIQTEQWRKAADAAASVLARGVDVVDGVRVSGKRGSVDKHFNGVFDDDLDDGYGGKIKGSVGIRMFGDLWKKK